MTIERCATVSEFVVSRIGRLYPVFWTAVILTSIVAIVFPFPIQSVDFLQVLANLTMAQDYFAVPSIEGVYWSLAFELGFYSLIALVFVLGLTQKIELLGAGWLALSFVVFHVFPSFGAIFPYRLQLITILPHAGLFFAGIIFYRMRSDGITPSRIALLLLCYIDRIWNSDFVTFAIMTGIFSVFSLCVLGYGRVFASRPLVYLGTISYPLYLLHGSIGFRVQLLNAELGLPPAVNLILTIVFAIGLASAATFLVEQPANRLIRNSYKNYAASRMYPNLLPAAIMRPARNPSVGSAQEK
jgi:peptidoglycan/LPS O-acetylase OafA/YrhL